jgi:hypothetical protein
MRGWRFSAMLLLIALAAEPCSVSQIRKLWSKRPGSESDLFAFERNGRIGFIDPTGKVVVPPTIVAPIEDVGDFSDGLARIDHQGYIDETGRLVIKQKFWWEYDFSEGLAQVLVEDTTQKYGQQGFIIDPTGSVVGKVPAFRTEEFAEGLAAFEAEGKPGIRKFGPGEFVYRDFPGLKGFLDRQGNVVIKPSFAEVGPFVGGLARVVMDGYCYAATADGGKSATPTSGYSSDCGGAPADAVSPCKVGYINRQGSFAIQPRFEAAQDFQEELAAVRIAGLWGFIDAQGELVIQPQFQQVQSFREGLAAVKIDGSWGFIDKTGLVTISPRYEQVEPFSDSLTIAYDRQKPFYIDRTGAKIAGPFMEATPFVHGLAAVLLAEKHVVYIDHSGKTVFEYFRN